MEQPGNHFIYKKNTPGQRRTVIELGGVRIGDGSLTLMAGPCCVESAQQINAVARAVSVAGASLLRGGAFKPRTSPYTFQGLEEEGLRLLEQAKNESGLPTVSEINEVSRLPLFAGVDLIQVGARNMQNFALLSALGKQHKPVLLKRGISATLEELLLSAEHILAGGNGQVMLCERGIRTFETGTRYTLDLSAVPRLKAMTHLPVLVDPSHATGDASLVEPMALAAAAAGADGLLLEVHNDPQHALCDGFQALTPQEFAQLAKKLRKVREALREAAKD